METIREDETPSETENDTPIDSPVPEGCQKTDEEAVLAEIERISKRTTPLTPTEILDLAPTPQMASMLEQAPELYGVNPTTQEVMEFREKEQTWRSKLKSL